MLDPQRFTRGVKVRPRDLEAVMVRRLKSDLRFFGEAFPERVIDAIKIDGLPADSPELVLPRMLETYGDTLLAQARRDGEQRVSRSKLVFVGLQKRLLSSIEAFTRTLIAHRGQPAEDRIKSRHLAPTDFIYAPGQDDDDPIEISDEYAADAVTAAAVGRAADRPGLLAQVDAMLTIAHSNRSRPDARLSWLAAWVRENMLTGNTWNDRRLIIFTEWEATRVWLERRLIEALHDIDTDDRIHHLIGATPLDRREELKRAFNADPSKEKLRVLICTDAAREGINLQARCYDLIHFDLPWNPARLEQRNGRIDRKLQPAPKVFCRYFHYTQRPEDIVLEALVRRKLELDLHAPLGSCRPGSLSSRIAERPRRHRYQRGHGSGPERSSRTR